MGGGILVDPVLFDVEQVFFIDDGADIRRNPVTPPDFQGQTVGLHALFEHVFAVRER